MIPNAVARRIVFGGKPAAALLLAVAGALFGGSARAENPGRTAAGEPLTLRRMVAACAVSMVNTVCTVANGASAPPAPSPNAPPVFVAGAGAVDRDAYLDLQRSGKAMCARAQSACTADWSGKVCTTARSLWAD